MQASIFGNLSLTDSRTVDYYSGDIDQKHFQDIYYGRFYCSGNNILHVQIACNRRSLFVTFRCISCLFCSCIVMTKL